MLFVRHQPRSQPDLLIGLEWMPVPDAYVKPSLHGLVFDGRFNLRVAERAAALGAGALLVHAHPGARPPTPSEVDARDGAAFMQFMRRRSPNSVHGLLVVADETVTGIVDDGDRTMNVERVVSVGIPLREWTAIRRRRSAGVGDDRQLLAIGAAGQQRLATTTVAVVGNSGGGSHVTQQLIHAGVGDLIVVDADLVEDTNLRRLVGAIRSDVGTTPKPLIAVRTARAVRPSVQVEALVENFPSTATIRALRGADVIIGCVDGWDVRSELNRFALTYRIPYLDIGATVVGPTGDRGMRVGGQVTIVVPDGACLRCMGLVTDERVAADRDRRQGYAHGEPDPQVVSLNGSLASEAVTAAMMLLAGDDRLVRYRRYKFPPGLLIEVDNDRDPDCRDCLEADLISDQRHEERAYPGSHASSGGTGRVRAHLARWLPRLAGALHRPHR